MADDLSDPCVALAKLRPAYYALMGGTQTQEVEFRSGNGSLRRVLYSTANIALLKEEITKLEAQCAAQTGKRRQHAIVAG